MEKKYSKKYIGKQYTLNNGYIAKVVGCGSKVSYCTIQIENWITQVDIRYLKKGRVYYPYAPVVQGIGYYGESLDKNEGISKAHKRWLHLMERAYSDKYHQIYNTYKNVTVCKEWHNFQNYLEWDKNNYKEGYSLDKDLLSFKNAKIYSPETCIFIPPALNSFLTNKQSTNTSNYTGVSWDKEKNKWKASISTEEGKKSLGYYTDPKVAYIVYKKARAEKALEWQHKMVNILPEHVLKRII